LHALNEALVAGCYLRAGSYVFLEGRQELPQRLIGKQQPERRRRKMSGQETEARQQSDPASRLSTPDETDSEGTATM